jgi:uncharacterized protein YqgC (DUF456 family)
MLDWIGWLTVIGLFVIGMAGAVFPILPGVFAVFAGFIAYGLFFTFAPFGVWFWVIQSFILLIVVVAEYAVSSLGVKKSGGSRASVIGTNIGLLIGPFVIPVFGLILGPFLGAILGEMRVSQDPQHLVKVGVGSVIGLFTSIVVKIILQVIMILLFFIWLWLAPDLTNTLHL